MQLLLYPSIEIVLGKVVVSFRWVVRLVYSGNSNALPCYPVNPVIMMLNVINDAPW